MLKHVLTGLVISFSLSANSYSQPNGTCTFENGVNIIVKNGKVKGSNNKDILGKNLRFDEGTLNYKNYLVGSGKNMIVIAVNKQRSDSLPPLHRLSYLLDKNGEHDGMCQVSLLNDN